MAGKGGHVEAYSELSNVQRTNHGRTRTDLRAYLVGGDGVKSPATLYAHRLKERGGGNTSHRNVSPRQRERMCLDNQSAQGLAHGGSQLRLAFNGHAWQKL